MRVDDLAVFANHNFAFIFRCNSSSFSSDYQRLLIRDKTQSCGRKATFLRIDVIQLLSLGQRRGSPPISGAWTVRNFGDLAPPRIVRNEIRRSISNKQLMSITHPLKSNDPASSSRIIYCIFKINSEKHAIRKFCLFTYIQVLLTYSQTPFSAFLFGCDSQHPFSAFLNQ